MTKAQRQRGSLVWLAILTIAAVGAVRAEGNWSVPAPYTQSMLRFLAAHPDADALSATGPGVLERWSAGLTARAYRAAVQGHDTGLWSVMLPVVFVGLAAPVSLVGRLAPSTPAHVPVADFPSCANRPPPSLLA